MTAIIVVEVEERDVIVVRKAIQSLQASGVHTRNAVFREKPSRWNFGVDLYEVCRRGLAEIIARAGERGYTASPISIKTLDDLRAARPGDREAVDAHKAEIGEEKKP